jgi:hypothetical protein
MELGDTRLIINECQKESLTLQQAAYVLATAYWETARTVKPVQEAFWLSDNWRRKNLRYYPWHGRGYVQLTWEKNYRRASKEIGVDLVSDPREAMNPETATKVLVAGCKGGWFTGKKLSDYITDGKSDYVNARRVVNGTDKAKAIAALAEEYEENLRAEGYGSRSNPSGLSAMFRNIINALFKRRA